MKLVKFMLGDEDGAVYVNPRQVVAVNASGDPGATRITMRDGWLVYVHGDADAVAQALDGVKRLSCADPGPDMATLTLVVARTDMSMPPTRAWPVVVPAPIEVDVADVLCVSRSSLPGTRSVLYMAGLTGPLELSEPPDIVAARLEGRQ